MIANHINITWAPIQPVIKSRNINSSNTAIKLKWQLQPLHNARIAVLLISYILLAPVRTIVLSNKTESKNKLTVKASSKGLITYQALSETITTLSTSHITNSIDKWHSILKIGPKSCKKSKSIWVLKEI